MKTRQQPLRDDADGWQSRAGKESDAQKLDDVRVVEGAHQLTFSHELRRGLGVPYIPFLEEGVHCFGGANGSRYHHFFHSAVSLTADYGSSKLDVGENEGPQPWMVAEKPLGGLALSSAIVWSPNPTQKQCACVPIYVIAKCLIAHLTHCYYSQTICLMELGMMWSVSVY